MAMIIVSLAAHLRAQDRVHISISLEELHAVVMVFYRLSMVKDVMTAMRLTMMDVMIIAKLKVLMCVLMLKGRLQLAKYIV